MADHAMPKQVAVNVGMVGAAHDAKHERFLYKEWNPFCNINSLAEKFSMLFSPLQVVTCEVLGNPFLFTQICTCHNSIQLYIRNELVKDGFLSNIEYKSSSLITYNNSTKSS